MIYKLFLFFLLSLPLVLVLRMDSRDIDHSRLELTLAALWTVGTLGSTIVLLRRLYPSYLFWRVHHLSVDDELEQAFATDIHFPLYDVDDAAIHRIHPDFAHRAPASNCRMELPQLTSLPPSSGSIIPTRSFVDSPDDGTAPLSHGSDHAPTPKPALPSILAKGMDGASFHEIIPIHSPGHEPTASSSPKTHNILPDQPHSPAQPCLDMGLSPPNSTQTGGLDSACAVTPSCSAAPPCAVMPDKTAPPQSPLTARCLEPELGSDESRVDATDSGLTHEEYPDPIVSEFYVQGVSHSESVSSRAATPSLTEETTPSSSHSSPNLPELNNPTVSADSGDHDDGNSGHENCPDPPALRLRPSSALVAKWFQEPHHDATTDAKTTAIVDAYDKIIRHFEFTFSCPPPSFPTSTPTKDATPPRPPCVLPAAIDVKVSVSRKSRGGDVDNGATESIQSPHSEHHHSVSIQPTLRAPLENRCPQEPQLQTAETLPVPTPSKADGDPTPDAFDQVIRHFELMDEVERALDSIERCSRLFEATVASRLPPDDEQPRSILSRIRAVDLDTM